MLDPRARARFCPRFPHRWRPQCRLTRVNGHVPDDGHAHVHLDAHLHRPKHARDVLRPLRHAQRPRRHKPRQFQFCRVHAVHCPVHRVRAARVCAGNAHPLPVILIPYPPLSRKMTNECRRCTYYDISLFLCVFVIDLIAFIYRTWGPFPTPHPAFLPPHLHNYPQPNPTPSQIAHCVCYELL